MTEEQLTIVTKFLETKLSGELALLVSTRNRVSALNCTISAIGSRHDILCGDANSFDDFAAFSKYTGWCEASLKSLRKQRDELLVDYSACLKRAKITTTHRDAIRDFIAEQSLAAKTLKRAKAERLKQVDDS